MQYQKSKVMQYTDREILKIIKEVIYYNPNYENKHFDRLINELIAIDVIKYNNGYFSVTLENVTNNLIGLNYWVNDNIKCIKENSFIITFGRYKGMTLQYIRNVNYGYFLWLKNDQMINRANGLGYNKQLLNEMLKADKETYKFNYCFE